MSREHRGTIFLEQAPVLSQLAYDAEQFVIRLAAPRCAAHAQPGTFAHLTCDASIPMRPPAGRSCARTRRPAGSRSSTRSWAPALQALGAKKAGDTVSVLGPIGQPFVAHRERPRTLLLGGGVGIPPMVFLAERLKADAHFRPLVLMGSEVPFPFRARPSATLISGIARGQHRLHALLEEWGVPSRLASRAEFPGCFPGFVTELAARVARLTQRRRSWRRWDPSPAAPTPMLQGERRARAGASRSPARCRSRSSWRARSGGCAGCTVEVRTAARSGDEAGVRGWPGV